ncbi:hypothetical protein L3X38_025652 [Prunus dulcis]|uniref:Integrase catalytic domain-containing protein n=1 Tax=Prunus dulcis TaxID=3755 RepID=A0AAD4W242_PRUDU|nr:hypothetical protein L3X38_025652 [Prunus dulcis]
MAWVYFLINKSNAFECFNKFKAMTELQSGHKVKSLRSDRGGEFMSNEFHEYCSEAGIQRQLTVAYSPQQNGVAERKNRTVIEMAKSMLHEKGLPYEFWAEAANTAVYLLNRCPSKSLKEVTPFEAYMEGSQGYRLYYPRTGKIILSRDVYFDETASWKWENTSNVELRMPMQMENQDNAEHEQMVVDEPTQILDTQMQVEEETVPQDEEILDRSQVFDHTPHKWRSISDIMAKCNMCIVEPDSFEEANLDESWRHAMKAELEMIEKNNTWELVDRPFDKLVIGVKQVTADKISSQLSPQAPALFEFLPLVIKKQVLLLPESVDSAQLSQIETEKIIAHLV